MNLDERMKQRLVGAVVLVVAAVVFVPMLLDQDDEEPRIVPAPRVIQPEPLPADADARAVPLEGNTPVAVLPPAAPAPPPVQQAPAKQAAPAKKAAPKKKAAPAKKSAKSGYAVQLGSFSKAANARGLRDKLAAKGYTAFVESAGSVTRVYVGPQPSRAAAEKMLKKLRAEMKLEGIVVTLPG